MLFKDTEGREYEANITLREAIALKKIGCDLGGVISGDWLERVSSDPETLVNVLWIVCEKSAQKHGVTAEDFGGSLGGDTLQTAVDSLLESIVNFSQPAQRQALSKLIQKSKEVERLAAERVNLAIDSLTPEMILTSLHSRGSKPESSESTPPSEHSENSVG